MRTQGVMMIKFQIGNTMFTQDFVVCDYLVRPMIIGKDFTVSNYICVAWMRQGMKKMTQDDRIVIEVEESVRGKTLSTTRRIAIPPRNFAKFELECDILEGKFEIKPEPFLQEREPNLWMDSFVIHNIQGSKDEVSENRNPEPHNQTTSEDKEGGSAPENTTDKEDVTYRKNETNQVCIPYCIFSLSYVNHSYILKGRVVAFAEKEKDEESEIFQVEEIKIKKSTEFGYQKAKEGFQYHQSQTLYAAQQR